MKVNPILSEWITLCGELVEALDLHHDHDRNMAYGCPPDCGVKQLIDRARRRLERVKK